MKSLKIKELIDPGSFEEALFQEIIKDFIDYIVEDPDGVIYTEESEFTKHDWINTIDHYLEKKNYTYSLGSYTHTIICKGYIPFWRQLLSEIENKNFKTEKKDYVTESLIKCFKL
jgi:hypothetical protein